MTHYFGNIEATRQIAAALNSRLSENPAFKGFYFKPLRDLALSHSLQLLDGGWFDGKEFQLLPKFESGSPALALLYNGELVTAWESASAQTLYRCSWSSARYEQKHQSGLYKPRY